MVITPTQVNTILDFMDSPSIVNLGIATNAGEPVVFQQLNDIKPTTKLVAVTPIGGHRIVKATIGGCTYADSRYISDVNTVIGITESAYTIGDLVQIRLSGEITEPSWSFNIGPVYLGNNGLLTQVVPNVGFIQQVGIATGTNTILINIKQPIIV